MIELYNNDCISQMTKICVNNLKVDHVICDLPYFQVVKNDLITNGIV